MATSTFRLLFRADTASAVRSVNQLGGSFTGLGKTAKAAGVFLAAGLAGGLAMAVKEAVSFDRALRNVNTLTKLSERQFGALSKQVLALSKETAQAPTTLAKGLYDIVSSGFESADAIDVLRVSAKAATAGLTDTATASKAVTAALNAYHLGAEDARKVSDVLFQTVNKGVLTFEELAQQMGDLVPAAAPLGISLEEVGAAIATITLQGVPAAEAATRVKNSMLALSKPSKALTAELKAWGFESGEAAVKTLGYTGVLQKLNEVTGGSVGAIQKLFSEQRAGLGVIGLSGRNFLTYTRNLAAMKQATQGAGATAAAFAEQSKSISFQWDKAKASLAAAAVPIGQLLFPALRKGAEAVGELASRVERDMPRIRAQFGTLASAGRDVSGVLVDLAGNRGAQAALVGVLSGTAAVKGATSYRNLAGAVRALPPGLTLAAVAVGLLGGAIYLAATRGDQLNLALSRLEAAVKGVRQATLDQAQAHERVNSLQLAVTTNSLAAESAQRALAAAVQQFGKDSLEARTAQAALNGVVQAGKQYSLDLRQAKINERAARERLKQSVKDETQAQKESSDAATKAADSHARGVPAIRQMGQALEHFNRVGRDQGVSEAAKKIVAQLVRFGLAKKDVDLATQSVADLTEKLGRVPSVKDVRLNLNNAKAMAGIRAVGAAVAGLKDKTVRISIITSRSYTEYESRRTQRAQGGFITRASGGFVPLMPGSSTGRDSVPAMLTPGEVVLNRGQQAQMGGPSFFTRMFGFSGAPAGAYAGGGFVQLLAAGGVAYPASQYGLGAGTKASGVRVSKPTSGPKAKQGRAYKKLSGAARKALAAVEAVNEREEVWDREYGQMVRGFNISREEFIGIAVDEYGQEYEVLDQPQIDQRLGELAAMTGQRHHMEGLIDEEMAKLRAAIRTLENAITALLAEIDREVERAKAEQRRVNEERENLAANRRAQGRNQRQQNELAAEVERVSRLPEPTTAAGRAKRRQYEHQLEDEGNRLRQEDNRLGKQERAIEGNITRHENLKQGHYRKAESLQGEVRDFREAKGEATVSLNTETPLDRRDVGLEIQELAAEEAEVRAIVPAPKPPPPKSTDGDDGQSADDLLTMLPAQIDLAIANAELTDTLDDDRAALKQAEAFFAGNLGKGSVAAQASVARALKAVRDDMASLEQEAAGDTGGGGGGGGGGDTGAGGGGGSGGAEDQALKEIITELERRLGLANLAVAVQAAQFGVIGSFAKGTLHVPRTGVALIHAGEEIRTAARVSAQPSSATDRGPVNVQVILEGDAAGLERFVKVKAVEAADDISAHIGRSTNTRFRAGRYSSSVVG